MKVLLINDPYIPVPPKGYGGIERVVELLALQFLNERHEVHLLAGPGSKVEGASIIKYGRNQYPPERIDKFTSLAFVWKFLWSNRFNYDIVINFGRLINLLPVMKTNVKKVSCYQRKISTNNVKIFLKASPKNLLIAGCSYDLIKRSNLMNVCTYIHNCVDFSKYKLIQDYSPNAPLIFLGRLERIKGAHIAIEIAKRTNNKLIIAGNISTLEDEIYYYENEIKPHIDGEQIMYVGQVNDIQKDYYLGKSKALLFPIEWNEPFGIVMIEAMACGTPVIGFRKGSVPEVIDHGITGYIADNLSEMIEYVDNINNINRGKCREYSQARFDVPVIASKYLKAI